MLYVFLSLFDPNESILKKGGKFLWGMLDVFVRTLFIGIFILIFVYLFMSPVEGFVKLMMQYSLSEKYMSINFKNYKANHAEKVYRIIGWCIYIFVLYFLFDSYVSINHAIPNYHPQMNYGENTWFYISSVCALIGLYSIVKDIEFLMLPIKDYALNVINHPCYLKKDFGEWRLYIYDDFNVFEISKENENNTLIMTAAAIFYSYMAKNDDIVGLIYAKCPEARRILEDRTEKYLFDRKKAIDYLDTFGTLFINEKKLSLQEYRRRYIEPLRKQILNEPKTVS